MSKRARTRVGHRNPTAEKNRRRERQRLQDPLWWLRTMRHGAVCSLAVGLAREQLEAALGEKIQNVRQEGDCLVVTTVGHIDLVEISLGFTSGFTPRG